MTAVEIAGSVIIGICAITVLVVSLCGSIR
jgi:hypothetical protein